MYEQYATPKLTKSKLIFHKWCFSYHIQLCFYIRNKWHILCITTAKISARNSKLRNKIFSRFVDSLRGTLTDNEISQIKKLIWKISSMTQYKLPSTHFKLNLKSKKKLSTTNGRWNIIRRRNRLCMGPWMVSYTFFEHLKGYFKCNNCHYFFTQSLNKLCVQKVTPHF